MSNTAQAPMPFNNPAVDSSTSSETQIYYFSRSRMALVLAASIVITVGPLLILAWFSLDPDWMPEQPDFSNRSSRRRGFVYALIFWAFFVLFMKLPFWIRIPFLLWSSYKFLNFFTLRGVRAFDREPDFVISQDGVGGWSGHSFHYMPWAAVTALKVVIHQPKFGGFDIGSPKRNITFHGPEVGPRRFFDTLPPKRIELNYAQGLFPEKPETILRLVRKYRPDLVNEEDLVELV